MTRDELFAVIDKTVLSTKKKQELKNAVDALVSASNGAKPPVSGALPPDAQDLLDEAVGDVITICGLNKPEVARKLISNQFYVAAEIDLFGGNDR